MLFNKETDKTLLRLPFVLQQQDCQWCGNNKFFVGFFPPQSSKALNWLLIVPFVWILH